MGFRPGLWLDCSKPFGFVSSEPFRGGLALVLWIVVLLQNPLLLELQIMDWWPDILLLEFLVESRVHGYHMTTTVFVEAHDAHTVECCYTRCKGTPVFQQFHLQPISSHIIPKSLKAIKVFCFLINETFYSFICSSWLAVVFALQPFNGYHFALALSNSGIMTADRKWARPAVP